VPHPTIMAHRHPTTHHTTIIGATGHSMEILL